MEQILCKYAIDKSNILSMMVQCSLNNEPCYNCRYCPQLKKPTMTDSYLKYGCTYEKNKDKEQSDKLNTYQKNHIRAKVNYYSSKRNSTSVSYNVEGETYSFFLTGKYSGILDIEYDGDTFSVDSIKNIIQI